MIRRTCGITVDRVARRYLLAEPDGPPNGVVVSLHGSRSSAEGQVRLSHLDRLADRVGAAVAFPQAISPIGSGYEWDLDGDLSFLAAVVEELRVRCSPPAGRVAMTGMSGGARMSCRFADTHAESVSMVGAVGGLRAPGRRPSRPVPILAFHGTADRINPYNGGGNPRWVESVPDAARAWAEANGQAAEPTTTAVTPRLTRTTYGTNGGTGEVTLWTSAAAGHTWPGAHLGLFLRMFLGRTTTEIDASDEVWSFAQRHANDP